ncbi:thioredoxin family protein [candidate division WOR-3 bacterium]|uniref:Thioredoxin family protein n=1 Tax=candidate division WOR-3 bacterium TaxID=2052148 RepID=A0A660SJ80_UNCW3|nr:MAG: thioredoxin family protein [candidate division WOR-3 bacterium]
MKIEVFGKGCPKCQKTEENAKKAVSELGIDAEVVHIYDEIEMLRRGISDSPALVIDGELKVAGRIPDVEEIKGLIEKEMR